VLLFALALRLAAWRWHLLYPLGGDEREYFAQALSWLQGQGYRDLPLMRPPLYPVFLATVFQVFDSQVQRVRLVQAIISTAAVYLQWLFVRLVLPDARAQHAALIAAVLLAASWTLAANATELLTETTFGFGLLAVLCLLVAARRFRSWRLALLAGIATGLLTLLRSVALPLIPLGACWLLMLSASGRPRWRRGWSVVALAVPFVAAAFATILPWTARNYAVYGHPILLDTTGAENLWLDNDPAGREAVKSILYAMGDDRGARQSLSLQRGWAAISADPARFGRKVVAEAQKLVALEYWDDLRTRRAIWVPPLEVILRLVLGDGVWLVLAALGIVGIWLLPHTALRWFFGAWVAYVVATNLIFHVELRYRLPLYPILACGAAALLARGVERPSRVRWRMGGAAATVVLFATLLLLHRPYVGEGMMLVRKHWALWRGDSASALRLDPRSALARVVLARDAIAQCAPPRADCPAAEMLLREAVAVVPDYPRAHVLLGAVLREGGELDQARTALAYETASLEDMQRWLFGAYGPRSWSRLDIGDGLDLGNIRGWHAASDGFRWTTARADAWLLLPRDGGTLRLRVAHGRPPGTVAGDRVPVRLSVADRTIGEIEVGPQWQVYEVPLPPMPTADLVAIRLEAPTFRPRDLDRADDDNRALGVMVDWIEVTEGGS
jgi:4-amino-4-deoxy-L-arabinose transferase-like glycosyltransferase